MTFYAVKLGLEHFSQTYKLDCVRSILTIVNSMNRHGGFLLNSVLRKLQ